MESIAGASTVDDLVWDRAKGGCCWIPKMKSVREDDEVLFHESILALGALYLKARYRSHRFTRWSVYHQNPQRILSFQNRYLAKDPSADHPCKLSLTRSDTQ